MICPLVGYFILPVPPPQVCFSFPEHSIEFPPLLSPTSLSPRTPSVSQHTSQLCWQPPRVFMGIDRGSLSTPLLIIRWAQESYWPLEPHIPYLKNEESQVCVCVCDSQSDREREKESRREGRKGGREGGKEQEGGREWVNWLCTECRTN